MLLLIYLLYSNWIGFSFISDFGLVPSVKQRKRNEMEIENGEKIILSFCPFLGFKFME